MSVSMSMSISTLQARTKSAPRAFLDLSLQHDTREFSDKKVPVTCAFRLRGLAQILGHEALGKFLYQYFVRSVPIEAGLFMTTLCFFFQGVLAWSRLGILMTCSQKPWHDPVQVPWKSFEHSLWNLSLHDLAQVLVRKFCGNFGVCVKVILECSQSVLWRGCELLTWSCCCTCDHV
jgi:hypothetical protein